MGGEYRAAIQIAISLLCNLQNAREIEQWIKCRFPVDFILDAVMFGICFHSDLALFTINDIPSNSLQFCYIIIVKCEGYDLE